MGVCVVCVCGVCVWVVGGWWGVCVWVCVWCSVCGVCVCRVMIIGTTVNSDQRHQLLQKTYKMKLDNPNQVVNETLSTTQMGSIEH